MKITGGNGVAVIEQKLVEENSIGEKSLRWMEVMSLPGWLDCLSGQADYADFGAKVLKSTHVFVADYVPLPPGVTGENCRIRVGEKLFDITLIDNPMGLGKGSQLEFYLKYTGGV